MRKEFKIIGGIIAFTSVLIAGVSVFLKVNSKVVEYQVGNKTISKISMFGKLMAEREYENDQLDGVTKIYYQNGNIKSEFNFRQGELNGVAKQYDQEGKLIKEDYYEMGKKKNKKVASSASIEVPEQPTEEPISKEK